MKIIIKYKFTFLIAIGILYLCLIKPPSISLPIFQIPHWDKIVHAIMYICLSLAMSFEAKYKNNLIKLLPIFIISTTFGGVVEILQYFNPPRTASWGDLLADAIGSALPLACLTFNYLLSYVRQQKRENKSAANSHEPLGRGGSKNSGVINH